MTNEFAGRYQGMSHQQLYNALQAGDPEQIAGQAAGWRTVQDTTRQIGDDLGRDLGKLINGWGGPAGEEYRRRLNLVGDFAVRLSDDQSRMRSDLEALSGQLKTAKSKAESPESVDDNDKTISGALKGAAAGAAAGPGGIIAGATVGGLFGHDQDEEEKRAAKERMVKLVSSLAADYSVFDEGVKEPYVPPTDLPGGTAKSHLELRSGSGVGGIGAYMAKAVGVAGGKTTQDHGPATSARGADFPAEGGESSLQGLDGGTVAAAGTAAAAGAGALVLHQLPLGPAALGATGIPLGLPAGGLLASAPAMAPKLPGPSGALGNSTSLTSSTPGSSALRPGGAGADGVMGRGGPTGQGGLVGRGGGAVGRGAAAGDEDPDEYTTWLKEDEMVWGDDSGIPPSVLGSSPELE